MKTDVVKILSSGEGREEALAQVDKFSEYVGLGHQESLRLRLLAEEAVGIVTAIAEDFSADFWLEKTKNDVCQVYLRAEVALDYEKKEQLIAVSTTGENEAAKGFMGKIRDIFQNGLFTFEEANKVGMEYGLDTYSFAYMGATNFDMMQAAAPMGDWSLQNYREKIDQEKENNPKAMEAWDELEKSIVASIADDVKVSIEGNEVTLVIEKKFD